MEQNQVRPKPVSRRMLIVIVVALVFILLPAAISGLPLSRITIHIMNSSGVMLDGTINIWGVSDGYETFDLAGGETFTTTISVDPGDYQIHVSYTHWDPVDGYVYQSTSRSCSVAYLETEEVTVNISA